MLVTNGGTHGLYAVFHALLEPGDEVIVPDPEWPPTMAMIKAAGGAAVQVPLREELGWRWNIDEVEKAITPKTRVLYLNSPNNPSGGVLTRADIERLAQIARERNLWVVSDEAYEDVVFKGEHVSIASLPGMYDRTIPVYTMSKTLRDHRRARRLLRDQGQGAARPRAQDRPLHDQQRVVDRAVRRASARSKARSSASRTSRRSCWFRRDLFYKGLAGSRRPACSRATPPDGAFYAFVKINADWAKSAGITGTVAVVGDG